MAMPHVIDVALTGSRVICNPPPTDTDLDILMLVDADFKQLATWTQCAAYMVAWDHHNDCDEEMSFEAFRDGEVNYIVTLEPVLFDAFVLATKTATSLNLLEKEKRIALFQFVLYGRGEISDDWRQQLATQIAAGAL
jgi:hypothetical protein